MPFEPFVGRAEVFGSHDRRTFTRLSSTAIYDVRGATRAASGTVVFPPSDFRYYRIRATGVKEIRGATAEAVVEAGAPVRRPAAIEIHQEERRTVIDADVHYRGLWVHELRFTSATPAFDRPVNIYGSMDGKAYFVAGGGRIYRFGNTGETTVPVHSRYRYLRIRVGNGDDAPLRDLRMTLRAYRDYILLAPGFTPPYRVLYGGPNVRPNYDFGPPGSTRRARRGRARPGAPERGLRAAGRHALVRGAASAADPGRAGPGGCRARRRGLLRPATPHCGVARFALGGRAPHCALVENPLAVGADVLLDLVGDPGVLTQRVSEHCFVLVELAGSSSVSRGHLAFHRNASCHCKTSTERVNNLSILC